MEGPSSDLHPDGPVVLAAWLEFYAMMNFFNKDSGSQEDLSSKLITELTAAGVLSRTRPYMNKISTVKTFIWDLTKERS